LNSKIILAVQHGISVHYSSSHSNYYSAWQYVTKEDEDVLQSANHPDLWNQGAPRTTLASATRINTRENATRTESDIASNEGTETPVRKRKRMSAFELSEIITQKQIKSRTQLLALANEQQELGKNDIAEFIINRGSKVVAEILTTAWEMKGAQATLERQAKSRLQLLQEANNAQCTGGCHGMWYILATQILERNDVALTSFAVAVKELLIKGRGKYRNIMIVGPANCGKTFLLNPLNVIYKTFTNPATSTFAWVGAETAECIFLNDFRWSQQLISWHDLLLLLEGQIVHLSAPKTHYSKDIEFDGDTPIFCTTKHPLIYVKNGLVEERESEMMSCRWKLFHFNRQFSAEEQIEMPSCPKCFAKLIISNAM